MKLVVMMLKLLHDQGWSELKFVEEKLAEVYYHKFVSFVSSIPLLLQQ